jgi:hypothetical protein
VQDAARLKSSGNESGGVACMRLEASKVEGVFSREPCNVLASVNEFGVLCRTARSRSGRR